MIINKIGKKYIDMVVIKFLTALIFGIIKYNPFKIIWVLCILLSWNFAGTFKNTVGSIKITDSLHLNGGYQYVYQTAKDSKIEYNIYSSDVPIGLINGGIVTEHQSGMNILMYIILVLSLICLLVALLMWVFGDDDADWSYDDAFDYALSFFIKTHQQGPTYYYYAFGKLLEKSPYLYHRCSVGSLRRLMTRPDYLPVQEKRNKFIEKILKERC